MARRNRDTLKKFFRKGRLPSEEDFSDLIDSTLNFVDEGFYKSVEQGLEISPIGDSKKVLSFYKGVEEKLPSWSFQLDDKLNNLLLANEIGKSILSVDPEGKVGVNKKEPETELDVNGIISAKGRIGSFKQGKVRADGKWHPILEKLDGCNAFEIMAGAGKKNTGKYALLHANVLNVFNSKRKIYSHQSYFQVTCNKIKLRWTGEMNNYSLEMRTKCDYGDDVYINYYITQLWFDPYMEKSYGKA